MIDFWILWNRAQSGPQISEREFDLKLFKTVREISKKYGITYDPAWPIPQEESLVKDILNAAFELLISHGVLYVTGGRIIRVDEEELKEALRGAPREVYVGEGRERVRMASQEALGMPIIEGGPSGCVVSEDIYLQTMYSYAREPSVKILYSGILETYRGMNVTPGTPIEMMASRVEAQRAMEAARMAGKPGMPIEGVTHAKTEVTNFADGSTGLRTSDIHEIVQLNELKMDVETFKRILFCRVNGLATSIAQCTMLGGFAGGPEGTAITCIAEALQGFTLTGGMFYHFSPTNINYSASTDRASLWVQNITAMALKKLDLITGTWIFTTSGPCTASICFEIAAQALCNTICGVTVISGVGSRGGKLKNHYTGMEARIIGEVVAAASKHKLTQSSGNDIVKLILQKYEKEQNQGKSPQGKSFQECYDVKQVKPSVEYLNVWSKVKNELGNLGLEFSFFKNEGG